MTQTNLYGEKAQAPCVIIGGVHCTPKRIHGEIRLVSPSGWVIPKQKEDVIFKVHKNGGMTFAIPSEILERE